MQCVLTPFRRHLLLQSFGDRLFFFFFCQKSTEVGKSPSLSTGVSQACTAYRVRFTGVGSGTDVLAFPVALVDMRGIFCGGFAVFLMYTEEFLYTPYQLLYV